MDTIKVNQKTKNLMSVKFSFQRLLMLITAILVASMTFTACTKDDGNGGDDGGDNGGGNGGVAGKRLKSVVTSSNSLKMPDDIRSEYSYNNDGTLKRVDHFNNKSKNLVSYEIFTSNSDGTIAKSEQSSQEYFIVFEYSYDANKKPLKCKISQFVEGKLVQTTNVDYTFENGKKIRAVHKFDIPGVVLTTYFQYDYTYDSQGRRTKTTLTSMPDGLSTQSTRTYNTDGTLQKITRPIDATDNTPVTETYTWENGKSPHNPDDYNPW